MFLLVGKLMRKIFFGTLRAAELEHLIERAWYAVTETCLAFTVYRDDLNARFVGIFAILLFLKCFHWLAEDRVDFMERSPNINILFHVRIVSLLTVLATCDIAFMYFAYNSIITKGAGTQLVFGFEYAILLATILNIVMKYILHWIDLASDSPWDEKAVCLLYTELVMSILKVTLYLIFVAAMLKYHNFPLFALRPIYLSLRTLKKALCDVIMSRRAIRNMNTLYPNATQEELANTDNVCIICREEMTGNGSSKKLPCNHIFHVSCLRSWFQRQQTCPTCRMDILRLPNPATNQPRNNQQAPIQQQTPHITPAGATGPQAASQANGSQQANSNEAAGNQPQVALHNEVTVVMMHMFAQMFLQALLANLRVLNQQQLQQQQQHQQQQQSSHQDQQSQTVKETVDVSTQTDPDPPAASEKVD
jgi:E3 ubiquitin-protein ligase synoviolin